MHAQRARRYVTPERIDDFAFSLYHKAIINR